MSSRFPLSTHAILVGFCWSLTLGTLSAQEVPEPILPSSVTTRSETPSSPTNLDDIQLPPPEMFQETPGNLAPLPLLDQPFISGPKFKSNPDILGQRIRLRKARTRAMKAPQVEAAWTDIQNAKTDPQKMEARYRYYRLLFAQMRRIDRSLTLLKPLETETYARLKGTYIPAENRAVIREREE